MSLMTQMQQPLWLAVLAWGLAGAALQYTPYSCFLDHMLFYPTRTPRQTVVENGTMTFGVFGPAPAVLALLKDVGPAGSYGFQLTLSDRVNMRIDEVNGPITSPLVSSPAPAGLLSSETVRYFWVEVDRLAVSFGRLGEAKPLLAYTVSGEPRLDDPDEPWIARFKGVPHWVHSCSSTKPQPPLACRKMYTTRRYDFVQSFPIEDEEVTLANSTTKAVRFMVRGTRDAHVRLNGKPKTTTASRPLYYEIDLNFINKIAIQIGSEYASMAVCAGCLSPSELRLFTVTYNDTHLEVFEGAELIKPRVSTEIEPFKFESVSFASMASTGQTYWLHACQGVEALTRETMKPGPEADAPLPETAFVVPSHLRPFAVNSSAALAALEAATAGCRMVHTFKYKFDTFFALSEEGVVNNTLTVLPFRVLGAKDFHMQLVSSMPPKDEEKYEIDIDFYNRTNLDRGGSARVVSYPYRGYASPTELRGFLLTHDLVTGVLNLTTHDGRTVLTWRDPRPFPLRYFSVASGSSAGNDTTWVFGCPGDPPTEREKERVESGCSRPMHTHWYSHSQYFSVSREGTVNGSLRTINVFVRAKGSGHVRLEYVLPPLSTDAAYEVDLSHENNTSIDCLGKRMATKRTPDLLSEKELKGFWIRQDLAKRRLDVGAHGSTEPIVSYIAPNSTKFPEIRYFSFTTSRSVVNGTWVYGCKGDRVPVEQDVDSVAEGEFFFGVPREEDEGEEADQEEASQSPRPSAPTFSPFIPFGGRSSKVMVGLHVFATDPPENDLPLALSLHITKINVNDFSGMLEIRGHLRVVWNYGLHSLLPILLSSSGLVDDSEAEINSRNVWTPEFLVRNGDADLGGMVYFKGNGMVRWEATLQADAYCNLQAKYWPHDEHHCEIALSVDDKKSGHGGGLSLHRAQSAAEVAQAAEPLWRLIDMTVDVGSSPGEARSAHVNNTLKISVKLRRSTPVLQHILLAPFIVLAALCLLAYWVPEPLPRDKVFLGCASLLLIVLTFIVLEAACPPGLIGMPGIIKLYCYSVIVVTLSVIVSAILSAIARDAPKHNPPLIVCRFLTNPTIRWFLLLNANQVNLRQPKGQPYPEPEANMKTSSQVYVKFENDGTSYCRCHDKNCSKQAALGAKHYWELLPLASERILSLVCLLLLLTTAILVNK